MADITFIGKPLHTSGDLPVAGSQAPDFTLVDQELAETTLGDLAGKTCILNIFPSVDTPVCAVSVRTFNARAGAMDDVVVLNVSADLPFAQKRFCGAEGIGDVRTLSSFRSTFAEDYGVRIVDGPIAGLCARAVVVVGPAGAVLHTELVPEIAQEPDYDAAFAACAG
ncbi:MAG: thiol peroxidase [Planctomycetota bacterium]|nr:thiol peroxidase [Planctomycetota bacterium]